MNDSELKLQLDKIVTDLAKTNGIDGSLIVDGNGDVLSHHLLHDLDIELFGPMAHVITSSSKRLINFANHGEIERVLVESRRGKALFLHLGNVHFIVLMSNKANVGMVMISSKRASEQIIELTQDLTPIQLEEIVEPAKTEPEEEIAEETTNVKIATEPVEESTTKPVEEPTPVEEPITESTNAETTEKPEEETPAAAIEEPVTQPEEVEIATELKTEEPAKESLPAETIEQQISQETTDSVTGEANSESETEGLIAELDAEPGEEVIEEKPKATIPVIKPPIAFPKLKKVTKIPEDETERVDLILKIYESILLAMSIGASKIMGVAPARGLTRKFLPVEECRKLLDGVDVKNNSTIDFEKIRENAEKIPLSERETSFKDNFGKIIYIITENYGEVMGYAAFRAMIRPQFKIINESYGHLLADLGIKDQLHPELQDFFN